MCSVHPHERSVHRVRSAASSPHPWARPSSLGHQPATLPAASEAQTQGCGSASAGRCPNPRSPVVRSEHGTAAPRHPVVPNGLPSQVPASFPQETLCPPPRPTPPQLTGRNQAQTRASAPTEPHPWAPEPGSARRPSRAPSCQPGPALGGPDGQAGLGVSLPTHGRRRGPGSPSPAPPGALGV